MSKSIRDWEATVARMAGNIASGMRWDVSNYDLHRELASHAVALAREILAEVQRTAPAPEPTEPLPDPNPVRR